MRTTVDLPDGLYRKTKAIAALRGTSLKELIIRSIEREVAGSEATPAKRVKLPIVRATGHKVDLAGFDLDDLLA